MFSSRFGTTFLFTVNVCIYIFRLHYLLCVGMNIRIINNLFQKKSCNFLIVYMYFFKRYQKAFTFFVSGGYMKFPNLIIRIIIDLNKIHLYVKYQLSEKILSITSHSKLLRRHDAQSDGIFSYL